MASCDHFQYCQICREKLPSKSREEALLQRVEKLEAALGKIVTNHDCTHGDGFCAGCIALDALTPPTKEG